jgi:uncharacterized protein (DUF1501 family)
MDLLHRHLTHAPALGRRHFLKLAGLAGLSWLTPVGHLLARAAEKSREPAQSIILLWLAGGPSQLETFDPHSGRDIAGGTGAVDTAVKGVQLAEGFDQLAEQMGHVALVRSMTSKEGDHERGTLLMKTGYRPDPTVVHPSIGAICCHELPAGTTDIPRHISILPNQWPGRGGFLGDEYDAFKCYDPAQKIPDLESPVPSERDRQRVADLDVVEQAFARGRRNRAEATLHRETVKNARAMMTSEQLRAFEINREPERLRKAYGDTPFGRGCLAARRLTEVGVRCVEVTLDGWDSHADNHAIQRKRVDELDPAFAALLRDLSERDLLRRTVVLCMGEFGRTPQINRLGGRDHWPNGFSIALAGGGIKGGQVIGETDPDGKNNPVNPVAVGDVHATVLTALGIDPHKVMTSPIGRTTKLSDGNALPALLG